MKLSIIFVLFACLLIAISACSNTKVAQPILNNVSKVNLMQQKEEVKEICRDECLVKEIRCAVDYNNVYQECGSFNEDNCWEWGPLTRCQDDAYCQNGQCIRKIAEKEKISEEEMKEPIQPKQSELSITPLVPVQSTYFSSGDYPIITGVQPFLGSPDAPLKILFVRIGDVPYYTEIKENIINNQLKNISPFKENFNSMAFYSLDISRDDILNCAPSGMGLGSSGFGCDNQAVYNKLEQQIGINDRRGIIIIAMVETDYGGLGGDIIYMGVRRDIDLPSQLQSKVAVHEIGHNFGLADLYYGTFYFDGRPSQFWSVDFSRQFLNVDGPGCPKWCNSYKPPSQYTQSASSQCLSFTDRQSCVSFGRDSSRSCDYGEFPDCCVWSDTPFEYFETNCVPALGSENIGINCLEGSGCYFGAVYSNYAWRPVLRSRDSIMFDHMSANNFDSVSEKELNKIFECCLSDNDGSSSCAGFRRTYSDFLQSTNFKKRIGSCGKQ